MSIKSFFILSVFLFSWSAAGDRAVLAEHLTDSSEDERPQLVLQTGHSETVSEVVVSADGKFLASASSDNTVKIWEIETGREVRTFAGHIAPIKALALSGDGKFLASGGNDKSVRVWNVGDGQTKYVLPEHGGSVEALAFSPDGKFLASGGTDSVIRIWDAATGKPLDVLKDHIGWITALSFSPDSLGLASGSADNTVKIWELGKSNKNRIVETHKNRVTVLSFNSDGTLLASGASDGRIKVSALASKRESFTLNGHDAKILALGFLPDNRLISGDQNKIVKTWSVAEELEISSNGGGDVEQVESASFDSNAELIAFGKGSRSIELVKTASGETLNELESRATGFYSTAFSEDGHWLASGGNDNTIKLFDLRTGQARLPLAGHEGYVTNLKFTPDGRFLISAGIDRTVRIWDVIAGKSLQVLKGHQGAINSIDISSDGKLLATASLDRTIRVWNLENPAEFRVLKEHNDEITGVAFTPDRRFLISGSLDKTVRLWDTASFKSPRKILTGTANIENVSVSPNGTLLAVAAENEIKIYDLKLDKLTNTLTGHTNKIYALAFSPDSRKIASAGADNSVRIWQTDTGQETNLLAGHTNIVHGLSFSKNGEWLASGSEDGSTIIWKTANFSPRATLISLRTDSEWLVVTPEGLFDGSPAAWSQILWRFGAETFNVQPVEIFFNEFFLPGLLADVFADKPLELPGGKDISKIDRRQPQIKILSFDGQTPSTNKIFDKRTINIRIEATENGESAGSGAKDLRLFRNGSLVKVWRGDVFDLPERENCRNVPKNAGQSRKIVCEISVPVVYGQNKFSAYAFNNDNVKSVDSVFSASGGESLKRRGNLYILAVGINRYEDEKMNLKFAVADAAEIGSELKKQQEILGTYNEPKVITLTDEEATKENILYSLGRFSASDKRLKSPSNLSRETSEKIARINEAQPEDVILLYFAGHGFASENRFYLIPHDLGVTKNTADRIAKLRENSISDVELEKILEFIDAGKILFVIDACNSGELLEAEEKRRGPMNSRGLAQLAFEKGMYILTAAQGFQAALEVSRTSTGKDIKHGLLTFSLLEGLITANADVDVDKNISEREWFGFAVEKVPQIQLEEMKMRSIEIGENGGTEDSQKRTDIVFLDGDDKNKKPEDRVLQTPRVFYRREAAVKPFIVAKP